MDANLIERYMTIKERYDRVSGEKAVAYAQLQQLEGEIIDGLLGEHAKSIRHTSGTLFSLSERWSAKAINGDYPRAALTIAAEVFDRTLDNRELLQHRLAPLLTINHMRAASAAREGIDLDFALEVKKLPTLSVRKG